MDMISRVDETKRRNLRLFELKYRHTVKDWDFKPGRLVHVRNSGIEKNLDRKMLPRYKGPMVVIRRTKGGSYIIAELDGTVLKEKVGAFRVVPHVARYEPIELPDNIHQLIDLTAEQLDAMVDDAEDVDTIAGNDYIFDAIPNLRLQDSDDDFEVSDDDFEVPDRFDDSDDDAGSDVLDYG